MQRKNNNDLKDSPKLSDTFQALFAAKLKLEKNLSNVTLYFDFDGTMTSKAGRNLINTSFYNSLYLPGKSYPSKDFKSEEVMVGLILAALKQAENQDIQISDKNYLFLRSMVRQGATFNILSKNFYAYIRALIIVAEINLIAKEKSMKSENIIFSKNKDIALKEGQVLFNLENFEAEILNKINIYDISASHDIYHKYVRDADPIKKPAQVKSLKGTCIYDIESNKDKTAALMVIGDDDVDDFKSMENAAQFINASRGEVLAYQKRCGKFDFENIEKDIDAALNTEKLSDYPTSTLSFNASAFIIPAKAGIK